MFSFNPFVQDFTRPKSYGFFDDDFVSDPFSRNYYAREQPSLFRSSSFRQPNYYKPTYRKPSYQPNYQQYEEDDENNEECDLFSDFFNLKPTKKTQNKVNKESKNQKTLEPIESNVQQNKNQLKKPKNLSELRQMKLSKSNFINEDKTLVATRFDTENEIEFKFNYKCDDPSGIDVLITKDGYIELKTADGFNWKSKLPENVDVEKSCCKLVNSRLSLKLPKKIIEKYPKSLINSNDQKVDSDYQKTNSDSKKTNSVEQAEVKKDDLNKETKELDPDAPIVEDIDPYSF